MRGELDAGFTPTFLVRAQVQLERAHQEQLTGDHLLAVVLHEQERSVREHALRRDGQVDQACAEQKVHISFSQH